METFGEKVRRWRRDKNYTLSRVAGDVGISITYLSQIEKGQRTPPCIMLINAIADSLWISKEQREQLHRSAVATRLAERRKTKLQVELEHTRRQRKQR